MILQSGIEVETHLLLLKLSCKLQDIEAVIAHGRATESLTYSSKIYYDKLFGIKFKRYEVEPNWVDSVDVLVVVNDCFMLPQISKIPIETKCHYEKRMPLRMGGKWLSYWKYLNVCFNVEFLHVDTFYHEMNFPYNKKSVEVYKNGELLFGKPNFVLSCVRE